MTYEYNNIQNEPNLIVIRDTILNSTMTNKSFESMRWEQTLEKLFILFSSPLDSNDKIKLDEIVDINTGA